MAGEYAKAKISGAIATYTCKFCGASFTLDQGYDAYVAHIESEHRANLGTEFTAETPTGMQRLVECNICHSKYFPAYSKLFAHIIADHPGAGIQRQDEFLNPQQGGVTPIGD